MKNINDIDSEIRSIITKCFKKSQSFDVSAKLADMKKRLKTLNEADLEWLFNLSDEIS